MLGHPYLRLTVSLWLLAACGARYAWPSARFDLSNRMLLCTAVAVYMPYPYPINSGFAITWVQHLHQMSLAAANTVVGGKALSLSLTLSLTCYCCSSVLSQLFRLFAPLALCLSLYLNAIIYKTLIVSICHRLSCNHICNDVVCNMYVVRNSTRSGKLLAKIWIKDFLTRFSV